MLNVSALENKTPKIYLDDVNFGILLEKAGFNTGKNSVYNKLYLKLILLFEYFYIIFMINI